MPALYASWVMLVQKRGVYLKDICRVCHGLEVSASDLHTFRFWFLEYLLERAMELRLQGSFPVARCEKEQKARLRRPHEKKKSKLTISFT